jgi:uncharacterized protein YuzE
MPRKADALKTSYDPEVDALFVRFTGSAIVESGEVSPDLVVDYDEVGRIVGFEILNATLRLGEGFAMPSVAI